MKRPGLLIAGVVALALGLVLIASGTAHAGDLKTTVVSPVHCGPVYCWQHKTLTIHVHASRTIVETFGHRRPVESRSIWTTPAFTAWSLRSVVVTTVPLP